MKANNYMHEAKNVGAVLGRKHGVTVSFEGNQACTDGQHITLPSLNEGAELDDFTVTVARGYVDHEAAHIKWTDDAAYAEACRNFDGDELKSGALNALEDVRIERHLTTEYEGSKDNLDATCKAVLDELDASLPKPVSDMGPTEIGALAATWYGRMQGGYGEVARGHWDELDEGIKEVVSKHVDKINMNTSTADVGVLAAQMADALAALEENYQNPPQRPTPSEDGDEEGDEESGEGEGQGEGEGESDGESGDGENGDGDGDGDEGDGEGEGQGGDGDGDGDGDGEEGSGQRNKDIATTQGDKPTSSGRTIDPRKLGQNAIERMLDEPAKKAAGRDASYKRYGDARDVDIRDVDEDDMRYQSVLDETSGQTNVLRRTLERKLAAKMKRDWHGGQKNGRLDNRRLVGAYQRAENVYKIREDSSDIDTAVMLLIDHSGSMNHRIYTAMKATVALCEALENTPISYAVQGFTTARKYPTGNYSDCDSAGAVKMIHYKDFEDRLVRVRGKLGGMLSTFDKHSHFNLDGVSVTKASRELLARPEKRKVLMVLSDGSPADSIMSNDSGSYRHLKYVVKSLTAKGVDLFGIGIESEAVRHFYPDYAVLNDVSELESKVIRQMDSMLLGGRGAKRNAC